MIKQADSWPLVNAEFFVEQVGGGQKLNEEMASPEKLLSILVDWAGSDSETLSVYKEQISEFKRTIPVKGFAQYLQESL